MLTLEQRYGKTQTGELVDTSCDNIMLDDRCVAWAIRCQAARLVLLEEISESQIAEAKRLLASRECEDGTIERPVTMPPPPMPTEDDEDE